MVDAYRVTDKGNQQPLKVVVRVETRSSGDSSAWVPYLSYKTYSNDGHYSTWPTVLDEGFRFHGRWSPSYRPTRITWHHPTYQPSTRDIRVNLRDQIKLKTRETIDVVVRAVRALRLGRATTPARPACGSRPAPLSG